jgi:hypothetical protein
VTEPALWFSYRAFKGDSARSTDVICPSCHLKIRKRVDLLKKSGKADPHGFVKYVAPEDEPIGQSATGEEQMDLSGTEMASQSGKCKLTSSAFRFFLQFTFSIPS